MMTRELSILFVEGDLDASVAIRLATECDFIVGVAIVAGSNQKFLAGLSKYRAAAAHVGKVFALGDAEIENCAVTLLETHLPRRARSMVARLAVPMVEAWLLADHEGIGSWLGIHVAKVRDAAVAIKHPKDAIVSLAAAARRADLREGLRPRPGVRARVGAEYAPLMSDFVRSRWDPARAAPRSPSLAKAIQRLEELRDL